jgi:hypothetical protein
MTFQRIPRCSPPFPHSRKRLHVPQHSCVHQVDILWDGLQTVLPQGVPRGRPLAALDALRSGARQLPVNPDPATMGWVKLGACARVFGALSDVLVKHEAVDARRGCVDALHRNLDGQWSTTVNGSPVVADAVVLASGGTPEPVPTSLQPRAWAAHATARGTDSPSQPRVLPVDEALQLEKLRRLIGPAESVAVVGGGHTGLVLLRMLHDELRCDASTAQLTRIICRQRGLRERA